MVNNHEIASFEHTVLKSQINNAISMLTCLFSTEISVAEHERKDFHLLCLDFMSCKKIIIKINDNSLPYAEKELYSENKYIKH
jgi:hypothetical protein